MGSISTMVDKRALAIQDIQQLGNRMQPDYTLECAYIEIRRLAERIEVLERADRTAMAGQVKNVQDHTNRLNSELYHYSRQVDALSYQVEQLTALLQQRLRLTLADDGTIQVEERDR